MPEAYLEFKLWESTHFLFFSLLFSGDLSCISVIHKPKFYKDIREMVLNYD